MTKKKSVFLRSAILLLVVAMVGATLLAANTTLARYRSIAVGTADAEIAAWSITLDGDCITTMDGDFDFDLVIVEWTGAPHTAAFGDEGTPWEEDDQVNEGFFAPGTIATFGLPEIVNESDVTALITVTITVDDDIDDWCDDHELVFVEDDVFNAALRTELEDDFDGSLVVGNDEIVITAVLEPGEEIDLSTLRAGLEWEIADEYGCEYCTEIGIAAANGGLALEDLVEIEIIAVQVD